MQNLILPPGLYEQYFLLMRLYFFPKINCINIIRVYACLANLLIINNNYPHLFVYSQLVLAVSRLRPLDSVYYNMTVTLAQSFAYIVL